MRTPRPSILRSFSVQDIARQPVGGNAVAHHAAARPRVANLDLMAEAGEVVGGRKPAGPGADHEHPLAGHELRPVELPPLLQREVAQEPLDRVIETALPSRLARLQTLSHGW